jgi:DNA-binding NtrC family response regulator
MTTQTFSPQRQVSTGFVSWHESSCNQQLEVGDLISIGRDSANQIVLSDGYASSRHARIERKDAGFFLRDLRSRNGTFLNGARVMEAWLSEGDRIRIGNMDLLFSCSREESQNNALTSSRNLLWQSQLSRLPSISETGFPVLLTGPSGTGKDVLAQALHRMSPRRAGPFVSVNCSALSESLVESELFGHLRGSFTGATEDRKGAFQVARGGTLFLDEIGDLPLSLQPKLLRALENQQIRAVGSDHATRTDVRIVAATHHCLKRLVLEERFRSDLFFRLNVVQFQVPPLSERIEDFEDLFYQFAKKVRVRFSHAAILTLKQHSWPGNIRELKNVVSRAKAFYGTAEVTEADVPQLLDVLPSYDERGSHSAFKPSRSVIKEIEVEMIRSRLIANRGNQRKTAADLGLPKSTLHDRIRDYGIDVEKLIAEAT